MSKFNTLDKKLHQVPKLSQTLLLSFFCALTSLSSFALEHIEGRETGKGLGLSFYAGHEQGKILSQMILSEPELFASKVRFYDHKHLEDPFAEITRSHCKFILWRPSGTAQKHHNNRIECKLSYPNYAKATMVLDLSNELFESESSNALPNFSFQGSMSAVFFEILKEKQIHFPSIQSFKEDNGTQHFYIGELEDIFSPIFSCQKNQTALASCHLLFPKLGFEKRKVDLGETAPYILESLCQHASKKLSGKCPEKNQWPRFTKCSYKGLWVPRNKWGAINDQSSISCRYVEHNQHHVVSLKLGINLVRPWGNRFSDEAIALSGVSLGVLYEALKKYSDNNTKQRLIEYSQLAGGPKWGMNWVSVKRHLDPEQKVASFSCDKRNTSTEPFYQLPVEQGAPLHTQYSCVIRSDMLAISAPSPTSTQTQHQ